MLFFLYSQNVSLLSDFLSEQIVYELPTTSQWCFEVSWCPRNPGVISTASFDGHVTISSVMGGGAAHSVTPDKVRFHVNLKCNCFDCKASLSHSTLFYTKLF